MENIKFFRILNRTNAILFLFLIIGVLFQFISMSIQTHHWRDRDTVSVAEDSGDLESDKVTLQLGNIEMVDGHNVSYVKLNSQGEGEKYSSRYTLAQTRNVLFFVGDDMESHWLFEKHDYVIHSFCGLKKDNCASDEPVIAIYATITKSDSNKDGELSGEDDITVAILKPDGSNYTEIETAVTKVISRKVTDNGEHLILILQVGSEVFVNKYSLDNFSKTSTKRVTEIQKKS